MLGKVYEIYMNGAIYCNETPTHCFVIKKTLFSIFFLNSEDLVVQ